MIPIAFGTSERPLLGLYDSAASSIPGNDAVLICHPWGADYYWSYGTLRNLARRYADAGTHAMRFDYFGCGDSGGDTHEASLSGCVDDALMAIEELQALTAAPTIRVAGLAFGALIASLVAAESRSVSQLLLWDPIAEGVDFQRHLFRFAEKRGHGPPEGWPDAPDAATMELFGGPVTPAFAQEVRSERIDPTSWRSVRSALVVTTSKPVAEYLALIAEIKETGTVAEVAECPWPDVESNLQGAIPVAALDTLVGAVA